MDDLLATAHRMLAETDGRRSIGLPQPFRSLVLIALELWSGFDLGDVQPRKALQELPPDMPVLIVAGSEDHRMPPDAVEALFAHLPTRPDRKQLWMRQGSGHGSVCEDDPEGYREHLRAFLKLVDAFRPSAGTPHAASEVEPQLGSGRGR